MSRDYMIYPDGDYFSCEEYDEWPSYKSDDFWVLEVPDEVEDDDEYIYEQITAVNLGSNCEQKTMGD